MNNSDQEIEIEDEDIIHTSPSAETDEHCTPPPEDAIPEWLVTLLSWPWNVLSFLLRLIGRFSKLAFLLILGGTTYLHFYQILVPPSLAESHTLHFDFPILASDRKSGVPANASVDFSFQRQLMFRAGRRGIDWSSGQASGSTVDVGVTLHIPESPSNIEVGTFIVSLAVFDKERKVVGAGSRSLVIRHKSQLLQWLSTIAWSMPLVLGMVQEQQTLQTTVVQLMNYPVTGLQSTEVSLSDSRLQVYSATIDIAFLLSGFRYYLYHWYFTSLVLGTLILSNLYLVLFRWTLRRLFGDVSDRDEPNRAPAFPSPMSHPSSPPRGRPRASDQRPHYTLREVAHGGVGAAGGEVCLGSEDDVSGGGEDEGGGGWQQRAQGAGFPGGPAEAGMAGDGDDSEVWIDEDGQASRKPRKAGRFVRQ